MLGKTLSIGLKTTLAILTLAIFTSTLFVTEASAGTLKVLHNFNGKDGDDPSSVIFDSAGNLYGVAIWGGRANYGTVFELIPAGNGHWNEKLLLDFSPTGAQGIYPSAQLIFDSAGNLYGTAELIAGGTGAVFELSPTESGPWQEKILHAFTEDEGLYPEDGLIFDAAGNLYSTAWGGGQAGYGTAFELTPDGSGGWTETTLHSFDGADANQINNNLISDASGNLYSTGVGGGAYGAGSVWKLTPQTDGTWKETTLYSFTGGADGADPYQEGGLKFDAAGNLYGTTKDGGAFGRGTVFELSPATGGGWTETVLHSFKGFDGKGPRSNVIFDATGNLYGETYYGGTHGLGTVFKLSPAAGGTWTETVLYNFSGPDGSYPWQSLTFDAAGNLYGTTDKGGTFGYGTVFELKP